MSAYVPYMRISIHALREESDRPPDVTAHVVYISIHALREESDDWLRGGRPRWSRFQSTLSVRRATVGHAEVHERLVISIHALREESDPLRNRSMQSRTFQSTLSVRRATL